MKSDVNEFSMNEVRGLLLKLIFDMSDAEKRKLLIELEKKDKSGLAQ